ARQDYAVDAEKPGYYPTRGPHRSIDTEKAFNANALGVQKIDLELRPIKHPVHSITRFVDRLPMPKTGGMVGFDLEFGDWVATYGKGRTTDFIFKAEGYVKSPTDYDLTLALSFSNPSDGVIRTKFTPELGSAFKFPYEAPLAGYGSRLDSRKAFDGKTRQSTV